jgi:hypothetical protein
MFGTRMRRRPGLGRCGHHLDAVTGEKTPPSNVRGYGWLCQTPMTCGDGGSLGELLRPSSVPLLAASTKSPKETLSAAVALAGGVARKRHGLGEFRVCMPLNLAILLPIRGCGRIFDPEPE